jgi:hypothetical protein
MSYANMNDTLAFSDYEFADLFNLADYVNPAADHAGFGTCAPQMLSPRIDRNVQVQTTIRFSRLTNLLFREHPMQELSMAQTTYSTLTVATKRRRARQYTDTLFSFRIVRKSKWCERAYTEDVIRSAVMAAIMLTLS